MTVLWTFENVNNRRPFPPTEFFTYLKTQNDIKVSEAENEVRFTAKEETGEKAVLFKRRRGPMKEGPPPPLPTMADHPKSLVGKDVTVQIDKNERLSDKHFEQMVYWFLASTDFVDLEYDNNHIYLLGVPAHLMLFFLTMNLTFQ